MENLPHISLWDLSALSSTVTLAFLVASSMSIFTKFGIDILSCPSGPLMSTVGVAALRPIVRFPFDAGGGMMSRVTPGGIVRGAPPMLEERGWEVVKGRVGAAVGWWRRGEEVRARRVRVVLVEVVCMIVEAGDGSPMLVCLGFWRWVRLWHSPMYDGLVFCADVVWGSHHKRLLGNSHSRCV